MPAIDIVKPKFNLVDVTIRQVYDAFEKNGLKHVRGQWYGKAHWDEEKQEFVDVAGCIMGQGAYNLNTVGEQGVNSQKIGNAFNHNLSDFQRNKFYRYHYTNSLNNQLNRFVVADDSPWRKVANGGDLVVGPWGLGSCIIHWNDAVDLKDLYILKTYEDVLKMAYEVMEPYFDKKVQLLTLV